MKIVERWAKNARTNVWGMQHMADIAGRTWHIDYIWPHQDIEPPRDWVEANRLITKQKFTEVALNFIVPVSYDGNIGQFPSTASDAGIIDIALL